ncbi:MAG: hypothetical protein WC812_02015 [Candidatus Pacearchaeota archaeon]|jgi:hypothetical protein
MVNEVVLDYEDPYFEKDSQKFKEKRDNEYKKYSSKRRGYSSLFETYSKFGGAFTKEYFQKMKKFRRELGLNNLSCILGFNKRTKSLDEFLEILEKNSFSKDDSEGEKILNNFCENIILYGFGFQILEFTRYSEKGQEKVKITDKNPLNLFNGLKKKLFIGFDDFFSYSAS